MTKCKETIMSGYHSHQCNNPAKRDGYCMVHHPIKQIDRDIKYYEKELALDKIRHENAKPILFVNDFMEFVKRVANHNYEEHGGLEDSYVDDARQIMDKFNKDIFNEKENYYYKQLQETKERRKQYE